jgi:magnesium and cobalt transporter
MNDDTAEQKNATQPSWLERLSHALLREPQDREQLIKLLHDAEQRHLLDADALEMIKGVLAVSEQQVRDIMIPRSQMVVIESDIPLQLQMDKIISSAHSRFPVIGENRDEVIGILLAKDLIKHFVKHPEKVLDLKTITRKPRFIPESKRLDVLLKEFRLNRNHIAIVQDEYGGVAGLITIEDVLEEIVGDIADEHDTQDSPLIMVKENNRYLINALTPIEEFNEYFKTQLSDEEFDTIGGLVTHSLGHLPKCNETITLSNYHFRVVNSDKRRIQLLEAEPVAGYVS